MTSRGRESPDAGDHAPRTPLVRGPPQAITGDDPAAPRVEEVDRRRRWAVPRRTHEGRAAVARPHERCGAPAARRTAAGQDGGAATEDAERPRIVADRRQPPLERARE